MSTSFANCSLFMMPESRALRADFFGKFSRLVPAGDTGAARYPVNELSPLESCCRISNLL
jgi:hypothetical protein